MRMLTTCCAAAGLVLAAMAQAENLPDPTKPPVGYAQGAAAGSGPVLQSILISPTRRVAVISGKTLHVGESCEGGVDQRQRSGAEKRRRQTGIAAVSHIAQDGGRQPARRQA